MNTTIIILAITYAIGTYFNLTFFQMALMAISYIPFWEVFNSKEAFNNQRELAMMDDNPDSEKNKELEARLHSYENDTDVERMLNDPEVQRILNAGKSLFCYLVMIGMAGPLIWYFPIASFVLFVNAIAHKSKKINRFVMILLNIVTFAAIVAAMFLGKWSI